MANVTQYTDLIPSENQSAVKFVATVSALVQPFVDGQNVMQEMPADYDLDLAVGSELDVCGQWIGLSRNLRTPLTGVFFSFGDAALGFGAGLWNGSAQPYGLTVLDDETYRTLLYAKAVANSSDGTLGTAQQIMGEIVSTLPGSLAFVQDNHDMSITIGLAGVNPPPVFQYLIFKQYVPVRPGGVRLESVLMSSVSGTPLFGFGCENEYIAGFGVGSFGTHISF